MSKTPMTWLGLIKMKLSERKVAGKSASIGDVTPEAKKEWVQIKEGKHPKFTQGKAETFKRKSKGANMTKKERGTKGKGKGKGSSAATPAANMDIQEILNKCKLCPKCKKNIEKMLKKNSKMSGGKFGDDAAPVNGGSSGGCSDCGQNGGCGCGSVL
jgi:hypothetical protein